MWTRVMVLTGGVVLALSPMAVLASLPSDPGAPANDAMRLGYAGICLGTVHLCAGAVGWGWGVRLLGRRTGRRRHHAWW